MSFLLSTSQQQLYCCDFNKCHFFQLKIDEYDNRKEFIEDTHPDIPFKSKHNEFKGAVIQLLLIDKFEGIYLKNPDKIYKKLIILILNLYILLN